jgi:histidinol-phosphate aminotransferase
MFENLANLKTYEAGKPIELVVREYGIKPEDIIKLASNENPYGPPPKAVEAVKKNANLMHRYPDDSFYELKEGLSHRFDVNDSNIIIGAGSDQILEFAIHAVMPKKVLMAGITFAMYEIYSKQVGAEILKTPSKMHNLDEFYEMYKKNRPEIIFLCVPNNPLGECIDAKDVFEFIEKIDENTLIIIDGAYQEFAAFKDKNKEIKPKEILKYKNVLYTGTFSKAYGLGGMRVGYGIANEFIIKLNAELATAVMMGTRMTLIITDNRGFGCINRLQAGTGGAAFNNLFVDSRHEVLPEIDFVAHAASMGARAQKAGSIAELESMAAEAIGRDGVDVIVIDTDPGPSTAAGGPWWEVGVPEVSDRAEVASAYEGWLDGKKRQLMRGE